MRTMLMLVLAIFTLAPLHAAERNAKKQATYTNPVFADGHPIHMGDPFAFRAEGEYYLTGTTSENEGFQMYRSPDLIYWKYVGWALKKTLTFWADGLFWAPDPKKSVAGRIFRQLSLGPDFAGDRYFTIAAATMALYDKAATR
jgi:hypothetical protein